MQNLEEFSIFFHFFWHFPTKGGWGVECLIDGLGATKTRLFGKKSGGTPNPQVKKLRETPNPDQIFVSATARAAEAGNGATC